MINSLCDSYNPKEDHKKSLYYSYARLWYNKNKERISRKNKIIRDNDPDYNEDRLVYYHKTKKLKGKDNFNCYICKKNYRIYNKLRHLKGNYHYENCKNFRFKLYNKKKYNINYK